MPKGTKRTKQKMKIRVYVRKGRNQLSNILLRFFNTSKWGLSFNRCKN